LIYEYIISVLDPLEQKIISPVLNLCEHPVGVPPKVMMTMTTSTMAHTPPRCSPHLQTIDKSSFIPKESTDQNSNTRCCDNDCSSSPKILRKISTGTFPATAANAVDNLLDDKEKHPHESKDFLSFLQEWDDFYLNFVNSTTYALAHSNPDSNKPFTIVDNDDDLSMSNHSNQPANSYEASLQQLNQAASKLEKVNHQFLQFLDGMAPQATGLQLAYPINNMTQQQPCLEPQPLHATQHVHPQELPLAPNPTDILPPQPLTQQHTSQFDSSMCIEQIFVQCAPPSTSMHILPMTMHAPAAIIRQQPLPPPEHQIVMMDHDQLTGFTGKPPRPPKAKPTKTPPWARPAVLAGDTHWPPPRLELKTIPYKKKALTKCTVAPCIREKDSLRPP